MSVTCLVGNGLSVAYNDQLAVGALTDSLIDEFRASGATDAEVALRDFAAHINGAHPQGFEQLLGPLDHAARGVLVLPQLSPVVHAAGTHTGHLGAAFTVVRQFLNELSRHGVGTALELISTRAHGVGGALHDVYGAFLDGLLDVCQPTGPSELTVATLNYDGLLHGALLDMTGMADLADGRVETHDGFTVLPGEAAITGRPLRFVDDLPVDRAHVLQLHGALAWLRRPDKFDEVWAFTLPALRSINYWRRWRAAETDWAPVVVLTNRKEQVVQEWPFSLAYGAFYNRLSASDRWIVAGYGFGDRPVNRLLSKAAANGSLARLLVVGRSEDERLLHRAVAKHIRPPSHVDVQVVGTGVTDCVDTEAWRAWSG